MVEVETDNKPGSRYNYGIWRSEKPFIYPTILGPDRRDLAGISLRRDHEGFTTRSTKFVFVATGNYSSLPQILSVSVTRIPVNKYRLSPIFHCRVHGKDSTTWSSKTGAQLLCY